MRLLLDTHYLFWMVSNPGLIGARERSVMNRPEHELLASPISFMELRIKWQALNREGLRKSDVHPTQVLRYIERNPIALVDLTAADCATGLDVPLAHRDPFDEMLLIHAQILGARLLTRDHALVDHPLAYRFA